MVTPRGSCQFPLVCPKCNSQFLHPTHTILSQENGTMTARAIQADRLGGIDQADIESKPRHLLLIA